MNKCAVVIPIYKDKFNLYEEFSISNSIINLDGFDIYWIAPEYLSLKYYLEEFNINKVMRFNNDFFKNIAGYNKLLMSSKFYERFYAYDNILILQPDAIILKPELLKWVESKYDYIGAPWLDGYSLNININDLLWPNGYLCNTFVGNGGLSLRNNKSCINLINEFSKVSNEWVEYGHAEDLFFGFMSNISRNFNIPNVKIAASFSHDINPIQCYKLNDENIPFGVHAWEKYEKQFWIQIFEKNNLMKMENLND